MWPGPHQAGICSKVKIPNANKTNKNLNGLSEVGRDKNCFRHLEFYDRDWKMMGTKGELAPILEQVCGIGQKYLTGEKKMQDASVATIMSWMAGRVTKEVEDIAYSMLGIFGVTMTPQYGEGKKAFMRLQRTLIEAKPDESIFAWTVPPSKNLACFRKFNGQTPEFAPQTWGLLAPSPDCFANSTDIVIIPEKVVPRLNGGCRWVQQGVQLDMTIKSGTEATNFFGMPRKKVELPLNCSRYDNTATALTIVLRLVRVGDGYKREECYVLGQGKGAKHSNNRVMGMDQILTRPLTVMQPEYV